MSETLSIAQRIQADKIAAMKARESERVSSLNQILAAIKQVEIDTRESPSEATVLAILDKLCKQRLEAIAQAEKAGRSDLVEKERQELEWTRAYLPPQLSPEEVSQEVLNAIAETGAQSIKEMGKVMGLLKAKLQGRADLGAVGELIKAHLTS